MPVRLGVYEDLGMVFISGVSQLLYRDEESPDLVQVLHRNADFPNIYRIDYPAYYENSGSMSLQAFPNTFMGDESISFFEGYAQTSFLLAPLNAPDPRADIHGTRHCSGGALSRVQVGTVANSPYWGDFGHYFYDVPNGTSLDVPTPPVTVIAGPQCVDTITWWQIQDAAGLQGWMPETVEDAQYTLNPSAGIIPAVIYCPQAPQPRLAVGGRGVVVSGLGANNLRSAPDLDAQNISTIPEGETFDVIGAPICADGFIWWNVNYRETVGWTVEGEGDIYWLAPAP